MRRTSRWDRSARVEMLPLIDVMFLLLVVFVYSITAMVRADAIPVDLPRLSTTAAQDLPTVLVVTVESDGTLHAGGDAVDRAGLAARVKELRAGSPDLCVLLNADADARHRDVAAALDALRASGQERVYLAGDKDDEPADR